MSVQTATNVGCFWTLFPDGPAQKAGIRPGQILNQVDGVPTMPPDLPSFKTGQEYKLLINEVADRNPREIAVSIPFKKGTKQRPPIVEPKAITVEILPSKIGVLRIPYFSGAAGMRFGSELASTVSGLQEFRASTV